MSSMTLTFRSDTSADELTLRVSYLIDNIPRKIERMSMNYAESVASVAEDVGELKALARLIERTDLVTLARGVCKRWEKMIADDSSRWLDEEVEI